MKLTLAASAFALLFASVLPAQSATPTLINILAGLQKCPGGPAFVMWTGSVFSCVPLPAGWTVTGTPPVLTAPTPTTTYTPIWQVETVSLNTLAVGSTSATYPTLFPPVSGIVNWWYNSTSFLPSAVSGVIAYAGQPLTFTLPAGWLPTDTITVSYQKQ